MEYNNSHNNENNGHQNRIENKSRQWVYSHARAVRLYLLKQRFELNANEAGYRAHNYAYTANILMFSR